MMIYSKLVKHNIIYIEIELLFFLLFLIEYNEYIIKQNRTYGYDCKK